MVTLSGGGDPPGDESELREDQSCLGNVFLLFFVKTEFFKSSSSGEARKRRGFAAMQHQLGAEGVTKVERKFQT